MNEYPRINILLRFVPLCSLRNHYNDTIGNVNFLTNMLKISEMHSVHADLI